MTKRQKSEIISTIEELSMQKVSRIAFEILANFYRLCKKKNISEREASFLFGKNNKYFVEILNPFAKEHVKTEFIDMLPAIASTSYRQIIPNDVKPKEKINIEGIFSYSDDDLIEVYKYYFTITYNDGSSKNFRWKIEIHKGGRAKINNILLDILKGMVVAEYFDTPKFALTVYLDLKKKYKSRFSPIEIQIALAKLCNKKADPDFALEEGTENMRVVYVRQPSMKRNYHDQIQSNG